MIVTLVDKLESLVSLENKKELTYIIKTLTKINNFKHTLENNLGKDCMYDMIKDELKIEFSIDAFCIQIIKDGQLSTLYVTDQYKDKYNYSFSKNINENTSISISIEKENITEFDIVSLNSYFNEIIYLIYIKSILKNLQESTYIDSLTNLKNRLSFEEDMKSLVPLALRESMKIGVVLINIDRFRAVNDEHGNSFGDKFLKMYANIIKETIRSSDLAIRFGGGEFLVLLVNIDSSNRVLQIASKIQQKLTNAALKAPNGDFFKKTVSIGIAMFPEHSSNMQEVVKKAEVALDNAKSKGRGQIELFQEESNSFELF